MNSMKNFVFLLILVAVTATTENPALLTCTRKLAQTHHLLCYVSNMSDSYESISISGPIEPTKRSSWPYMENYVQKRIADLVYECCRQPCQLSKLLSYC